MSLSNCIKILFYCKFFYDSRCNQNLKTFREDRDRIILCRPKSMDEEGTQATSIVCSTLESFRGECPLLLRLFLGIVRP